MKNTYFILTILFLGTIGFVQAQQRAALQSNGITTIFGDINPFVDAYNASVDGDTIYLSGGGYVSPTTIDKRLTIFGAGFHPDSTTATYPTFISTSPIYLGENADNLHLEGIEFDDIYKYNNIQTNNLTIKRCKISSLNFSYNGAPIAFSTNFVLMQSIVTNYISLNSMNNSLITNSILQSRLTSSNNAIRNNIFLYNGSSSGSYNNTFDNNVFLVSGSIILSSSSGNIFNNNIFVSANPNLGTGPIDNNNYKGVDISTVFVNQNGSVFDYSHDYHLQPAAVTTYTGTDGLEVGIYAGYFPFKEGAVPFNPHIQLKNIAPTTDVNGDLQIQIQVEAQDD